MILLQNNSFDMDKEITLQKEIELNVEKEKLEEVISLINKEILNYIGKRKEASQYIQDYRKNVLEEYRDDEDKVIEYFDHERYVKEEAFKNIDRRLRELTILSTAPYFGRVDFKQEDFDDADNIYIGRFGMTPEGEYEPVVIDWRAPISALFYSSKLGSNTYSAPAGSIDVDILLKRQFIIKKAKLLGLFDSAFEVKDEILQMVLSGNTSDKLRDIIMTIQEEQDNLIRQPKDRTIVVDGVAGSGKTTIALHRVAYLLYNYRESLQDKVLILGPNSIFMEYISTVLPSLGEVGVKQTTFMDFALDILELNSVMNFKDYMERVLKGDREFINKIVHKSSLEYLNELNEYIDKLDKEYFKLQDINFFDKTAVSKAELDELFNSYYKEMPLFRRSKKVRRIIFSKLKDLRDEEVRRIQKEYNEKISNMTKAEIEIEEANLNLKRKMAIREVIAEVMRAKNNMGWLGSRDCLELYKEINGEAELTQDDLAPILYLKIKLEGLRVKEEIKHVVIDEAQDYSPIQFLVVRELTKCSSMTIVGDSNQRLLPLKGKTPMLNLEEIIPVLNTEYFELTKSYRSTKEIMEYANKFLKDSRIVPIVRSGEEVTEELVHSEEELIEKIDNTISSLRHKEFENIAVLCRDLEETERIGSLLKAKEYLKIIDNEEIIYKGGTVVIPSYFAKGLEFDAVILVDESRREDESKLNYVMATRALHELKVIKRN
ncbi:UvrD-helicase domain-containing protein [Clostridium sp. YIM B02515]|uniref:DNA 3'-5' helicase n=1 Tax=Clostridium rhizosphaerae TaxID=2803861 RepID=A0ABS1TA69_9CLOT|nr:UvrD-helicase domain-containing protein [Clostridium rhizosphaerae]MBL4936256.1 UvrD-helicase domain-containing protein [Clostridium rhizosphaerae]